VAFRAERRAEQRQRLHGLWLLRTGRSLEEVAAVLGVHYRTVQRWVAWYREGGVPAVTRPRAGGHGQAPRLSPGQQAQLAEQVATGRFRTAAEVRDWIAAEYGVEYKVGGVYDLLARLRCRPKVPRPLHAKADRAEQERWKKGA
jgi:transposase